VEEWFKGYKPLRYDNFDAAETTFRKMGTNAIPFLAGRITRDLSPSLFEQWARALPSRFRPVTKLDEAQLAARILAYTQPPQGMLGELLKPALVSADTDQSSLAKFARRGPPHPPRPSP